MHEESPAGSVTDYRLGLAMGSKKTSVGVSYGWSRGDTETLCRVNTVGAGLLARPIPHLSVGLSGLAATEGDARQAIFDLGLRPLGTDRLTVFGDYALEQDQACKDGAWSTGAAIRVLPGCIRHGALLRQGRIARLSAASAIDLGRLGFASQAHYDNNRHRAYNTYRVRAGAYSPTSSTPTSCPSASISSSTCSDPSSTSAIAGSTTSKTLADLLVNIEAAKNDPRVAGIAINTSGWRSIERSPGKCARSSATSRRPASTW